MTLITILLLTGSYNYNTNYDRADGSINRIEPHSTNIYLQITQKSPRTVKMILRVCVRNCLDFSPYNGHKQSFLTRLLNIIYSFVIYHLSIKKLFQSNLLNNIFV